MQKINRNKNIRILLHAAMMILLIGAGSCKNNLETSNGKLPYTVGEVLLSDDFSGTLSQWTAEGEPPKIIDGRLDMNTPAFSAVWLKPSLVGNFTIEYDVTVLAVNSGDKNFSSFGCFAMATDPANPKKFFAAGKERSGEFSKYNNLNLYYVELGCGGNKTTKILRYGDAKNELSGKNTKTSYKIVPNQQYHIKLLFFEKTIEFYINDRCLFRCEDSQPYTGGNFGFTTTASKILIDNFVITHLSRL